jgi:hypothetical protein
MNVRTISIINWFKGGSQFHVSQVGKATKSMLQKTPIVTGNAVSISCVSFDGSGKKTIHDILIKQCNCYKYQNRHHGMHEIYKLYAIFCSNLRWKFG